MKLADIKVGESYYVKYTGKVTVTLKGLHSSRTGRKDGVRGTYTTSILSGAVERTREFSSRDFQTTWAEHEAHEKAQARIREIDRQARADRYSRRAYEAFQLNRVLEAHGVPSALYGVYGEPGTALVAAGFSVGPETRQTFARFDVQTYVRDGKLDEGVVRYLLADSAIIADAVLS